MCFVMAHGGITGRTRQSLFYVAGSKNNEMNVDDVLQMFTNRKCPALLHKPKIFVINTCRGDKDGRITTIPSPHSNANQAHSDANEGSSFPSISVERTTPVTDFTNLDVLHTMVVYSTMEGFFAWRDVSTGTLFMQSLLDVMRQHKDHSFLDGMLKMVSKNIFDLTKNGQAVEVQGKGLVREISLVPTVSRVAVLLVRLCIELVFPLFVYYRSAWKS